MDCLGDSITARGVYQDFIKEQLGFSKVLNHGIGGTTICGESSLAYWQDARIEALDENADVIHLRWISTAIREKQTDRNVTTTNLDILSIQNMEKLIEKEETKAIFNKIGINFCDVLEKFKKDII